MTTKPLIASRPLAGTPTAYIEVVIAWITSAPTMLANSEKRPPAPRAVPADHDREDRVELEVEPDVVRVRGPDVRAGDEAGHARAEAAEHVGDELDALLVDAAVEARPRVDARPPR